METEYNLATEAFLAARSYINECGKVATVVIDQSTKEEITGIPECNVLYGNYALPLKGNWKRIKRAIKNGR